MNMLEQKITLIVKVPANFNQVDFRWHCRCETRDAYITAIANDEPPSFADIRYMSVYCSDIPCLVTCQCGQEYRIEFDASEEIRQPKKIGRFRQKVRHRKAFHKGGSA